MFFTSVFYEIPFLITLYCYIQSVGRDMSHVQECHRHSCWEARVMQRMTYIYIGFFNCLPFYLGQLCKCDCQFLICRNIVLHNAIVEFLVGNHIKVSCTGQAKYDILYFAGLFTLQRLINGHLDGMAAFRSRQDTFAKV